MRQTYLSWLFMTETLVYKLKKPLVGDLFDFSTPAARRTNCEAELRLNGRLAPDIYLSVVPVTVEPDGRMAIAGMGEAVDWLVKMVRLPRHRMLDTVLRAGGARPEELDGLGRLLAGFYKRMRAEPVAPDTCPQRLAAGIDQDVTASWPSAAPPARRAADRLAGCLRHWLADHGSVLVARLAAGHFGEVHGDLRPEHVYLGPPAAVIDCLEFDRNLRLLDPAEELSYFALECELLGAAPVGALMLDRYAAECGDAPGPEVITFYKAWRALLRARQCFRHASAPGDWPVRHWTALAADYLHLGLTHATRL